MADCTSRRRSNWEAGAVVAGFALLMGGVYAADPPAKGGSPKAADPASPATAKITAVRFWSLGDLTRISIEVSSDFKFKSSRISNPERFVFDVQGAKPALSKKGMHVVPVNDGLLKQIRVAEMQPGVTRVVLDLEADTPAVAYTASQLSNPDRLMVELRLKDKPAPPASGSISGVKSLTDSPLSALSPDLDLTGGGIVDAPLLAPALTAPNVLTQPSVPLTPYHAPARVFHPPPAAPKAPLPVLSMDIPQPPAVMPGLGRLPVIPTARTAFLPPAPPQPVTVASVIDPLPAPMSRTTAVTAKPVAPRQDALPARIRGESEPSLTRALGLKLGRVVIDAGHGGHDAGTHGPSGLLEKDVVLDVALRLGTLIHDRLGSDVVYTRSDDTYIPLEQRTQIANEKRADLFLSIHANSSPYKVAAGVETYYLNFTTSKTALDLAAKENATAESSIFDLKDMLAKIAMKDKVDESREFATSIQNSLFTISAKNNAAAKNRGVKRAPFVVLIGASMPSVLAEIGFLTNTTDEALLKKPEHRQKIAEALYKGVASYADSLSHFQIARRD